MEKEFIQIITAVLGTVGFAMYFNIEKSKTMSVAIGGFIAWLMYLICFRYTKNMFTSTFISAIVISIYSEIMARTIKTPANILLIPSVIPLLPGSSFYYTMSAVLTINIDEFKYKGFETIGIVLGIVFGVVIGFFIFTESFKNITYVKEGKSTSL